MQMTDYRSLGRSGLVVSPLALGTMTFGAARWGTDRDASAAIFNAYTELGGNFVDTADVYSGGQSEAMLCAFIEERSIRDQIVLATKAGFAAGKGVSSGGNGARHIHAALAGSLKRLRTDFIDMFWIHVWDSVTPAEELLQTMSDLVRSGKIRYWGISNAPAWYIATLSALATAHGVAGPIALQFFYSLVNRDIEAEHIPLARAVGLGMVPWSPLAFGLLTGKYDRATVEAQPSRSAGLPTESSASEAVRAKDDKRLDGANPFGDSLFTERNWRIVAAVKEIASDIGETPARVALAWVCSRLGVTSTLMGVSRPGQVADNAAALQIGLSPQALQRLEEASSESESRMLYSLFQPAMRKNAVFAGSQVMPW